MKTEMNMPCRKASGRGLILLLAVVCVCLAFGACARAKGEKPMAPAAPTEGTTVAKGPLDGKALAHERCNVCHPFLLVRIGKIVPIPAHTIVDQMIRNGANLNPEEREAVIEYMKY